MIISAHVPIWVGPLDHQGPPLLTLKLAETCAMQRQEISYDKLLHGFNE